MLIQSWAELRTRYQQQANDYNHAAAFLVGIKQAEPKQEIEWKHYLPYQLDKDERLSPRIQELIKGLDSEGKIPGLMMFDLISQKFMPQPN